MKRNVSSLMLPTSSAGSGVLSSILGKILTRGSTVNVPSQSQLTFRLDQPLQLR